MKTERSFLECFFPVVDGIASFLGPNCEVLLHDLKDPEHSIIRIANGHVTGRKVGDALTDLGLEMLNRGDDSAEVMGNYNPTTRDGRLLKSNCVYIRNAEGELVGFICINLDVSRVKQVEETLSQATTMVRDIYLVPEAETAGAPEEHFEPDLWSIIQRLSAEIIAKKGKPAGLLTKEEKLEVIKVFDERGIFLAKGSIQHVSKSLGLSSSTLYRYLEELKLTAREAGSGRTK